MNKIDISIIIVNYRSWSHLRNCLNSINNEVKTSLVYEVIIIDNDSDDGFMDSFSKEFLQFQFFINFGNNGFANGCNKGASKANGDYLLFLNPDTKVVANTFDALYQFSKVNKEYGIVSCKQLNKDGGLESEMRFLPKFFTLFGLFRVFYKKKITKEFSSDLDLVHPEWISGSIVFINREWFDKVNGWDENYWMYFEDVQLSKDVLSSGGKLGLLRTTHIIHNHGGSSRLNLKTSAITKIEVIISKHVYVVNNFVGFEKGLSLFLLIVNTFLTKLILAALGSIFFFIPKLKLQIILFVSLIKYYYSSIENRSFLSKKSVNY
jgi:GT2 family glycosyltransferase